MVKLSERHAAIRATGLGCVKYADNMQDFLGASFGPKAAFVALKRELKGDFNALAEHLYKKHARDKYHMVFLGALDADQLKKEIRHLRGEARIAARQVYADMRMLEKDGYKYVALRIVSDAGYKKRPKDDLFRTGTHAYHVDSGDEEKGRFLCRYTGTVTQNLAPEDAVLSITLPEVQERLKDIYIARRAKEGHDSVKYFDTFEKYLKYALKDEAYNYEAKQGAKPFSFDAGTLVRQATLGNNAGITAGIHRAKKMKKGDPLKMLLVAQDRR